MKNNGINMFSGLMNMDRKQLAFMSKFMNTMYDDYGFLTEEDFARIDEIDSELLNIDKRLYSILTGTVMEEKIVEETEENTTKEPTIASLLGELKANTSSTALKLLCTLGEIWDDASHGRLSTPTVQKASEKLTPYELLDMRKALISERDNLVKTSKDRMKKNNPEQYKATQEMLNQMRLQVKNGNFDITSLLGIAM